MNIIISAYCNLISTNIPVTKMYTFNMVVVGIGRPFQLQVHKNEYAIFIYGHIITIINITNILNLTRKNKMYKMFGRVVHMQQL